MIKVKGGEIEKGEEPVSKRKKKRSSAYIVFSAIAFLLALYIYYVTNSWFIPLVLVILGIGIAVSSR